MNDPRSDQRAFYAWLLGVVLGAVTALAGVFYFVMTMGGLR